MTAPLDPLSSPPPPGIGTKFSAQVGWDRVRCPFPLANTSPPPWTRGQGCRDSLEWGFRPLSRWERARVRAVLNAAQPLGCLHPTLL